jgi:hypothetical protein
MRYLLGSSMISNFNLLIVSFSFFVIFTPMSIQGIELNSQPNLKDTNSIIELARKCLNVAKDEIQRGDLPIAFMFVDRTDYILAQASCNNTMNNERDSTITLKSNMCNWDDPESGEKYR